MSFFEIINEQTINQDDSAFPTLVKLDNGDIVCAFSVGGGPEVTGGSYCIVSKDNGASWSEKICILPRQENPTRVNSMRLTRNSESRLIAYGQVNYMDSDNTKFGTLENEAVFCTSVDNGKTWASPSLVNHEYDCPLEVSNPMVVIADNRWLAPAAILTDSEHLGEKVVVKESSDEGKTWNNEYIVFSSPERNRGFFEQKIIETTANKLLAFSWTVTLPDYSDCNNHFAWSQDGGRTWNQPVDSGIQGQTLTPFWLGDNKFLLIYNYRKSPQGIRLAYAEIDDCKCNIIRDEYLWSPENSHNQSSKDGIDSFDDFAFGLPSILRLDDQEFLAVFWCKENDSFGIKTIKFKL